jgi:hypothetical protein
VKVPVSSINATRESQIEAAKFKAYKTNHLLLHGLKKTVCTKYHAFIPPYTQSHLKGRAAGWSSSGDRLAVASDLIIHIFPSPQHRGKPVRENYLG